jgi:acyl-CoA synthetase (AMP-forming)/AMP-acid ligase II
VLPWAILGSTRRDANPVHFLYRAAKNHPERIFLRDGKSEVSFGQFVAQTSRLAASFDRQGLSRGQHLALVGSSGIDVVTALFACWWLGAIPCLLDEDTPQALLEKQLGALAADWLCVLGERRTEPNGRRTLDVRFGDGDDWTAPRVARMPARETALLLPTSGTEGYPKLCKISLGRLVLAGHAFGGLLLAIDSKSRIYCPLSLTHATALMAGLLPAIVHGCTLHLAQKFSASRFFDDIAVAGGTHVLYVGEMLRFVAAKSCEATSNHSKIERFVGNGLDPNTWEWLAARCPNARIVEFYGATELPALLVNLAARRGAMGRVPFRLWSRFQVAQLPDDYETKRPRTREWLKRCEPGQLGELLIAMPRRKWPILGNFEGYCESSHERRALLCDVFVPGDRYYRTGDVVYYDEDDFFYFVDRVGDVWRNRGHNVSTSWVAEQLRQCLSVAECFVTPVALDDSPYRVGLAVVVPAPMFELSALEATLAQLPNYARPELVRLVDRWETTRSFKLPKHAYRRERFSPETVEGTLYIWDNGLHESNVDVWSRWTKRSLRTS